MWTSNDALRVAGSCAAPRAMCRQAAPPAASALAPFSSALAALLQRRPAAAGGGRPLRCEAVAVPPLPALARVDDGEEVTIPVEGNFCDDASAVDFGEPPIRYAAYTARLQAVLPQLRIAAAASVRYVAYSSDVGESLRPVLKPWQVNLTYGIATAYVVGDVAVSGCRASSNGASSDEIARTCCHAALFQFLASLALPAVIIHTVVHQVKHAVEKPKFSHLPPKVLRYGPSGIGLAIIPFLPLMDTPCEHAVDLLFDTVWPSASAGHSHEE